MTATAWLFVATVLAIVLAGVAMEIWQRRLDDNEHRRRVEHARYMDEIRKQP